MKKLGVIGGLGPMATVLFMKMVVEMTDAQNDQEHIEMIVYHCPQIPDRTDYILGKSTRSPAPELIRIGRRLEREGAELIAVPCVTAGCFYGELAAGVGIPVIDVYREVLDCLEKRKISCVGLMATSGTIAGGVFQKALAEAGYHLILPDAETQADIMHIIYKNVKANQPVERERFQRAVRQMRDAGAETIILGCTELSVVGEECDIGKGYLDVMRLMAKSAVERCGRLRKEYAEVWG